MCLCCGRPPRQYRRKDGVVMRTVLCDRCNSPAPNAYQCNCGKWLNR